MPSDNSALSGRIERFWTWFSTHHSNLGPLSQDELVAAIYDQLIQIDDGLGLLVCKSAATNEVIFTCHGVVELRSIVLETAEQAPSLAGWNFIAFEPPAEGGFVHTRAGVRVDSSSVLFEPLTSAQKPDSIGIRMYVPSDVIQSEECINILSSLLQAAAGERAKMCVEQLDAREISDVTPNARPLALVGFYIDWKVRQVLDQKNRRPPA